jgi:hypothetical protein
MSGCLLLLVTLQSLANTCSSRAGSKNCNPLGQSGQKSQLIETRFAAASLVLNNSAIWITGGRGYYYGEPLASTEFVSLGYNYTVPGPNLTKALFGHCLISVNDSTALIIGGDSDNSSYRYFSSRDDAYTSWPYSSGI